MDEHTIVLSTVEMKALLKCLESLFGNREMAATARTLHGKVRGEEPPAEDDLPSTRSEAAAEASKQKGVVRDRTAKAKEKGMNIVPRDEAEGE